MNAIGTQTIETARLILRRIEISDIEMMYKNWTSDKLVTKYVTWPTHESLEITRQYAEYKVNRYNNLMCYDWIVVLKATNEPIGEIEAINVSLVDKTAEMGDCYGSKFWNQGYGTEALKAFIDFMLNKVEVEKVYARYLSANPASGRIMEKAGMHYDGALKEYGFDHINQKRVDICYYSIDHK